MALRDRWMRPPHWFAPVCTMKAPMQQPIREIFDQFKQQLPDIDPVETQEWLE